MCMQIQYKSIFKIILFNNHVYNHCNCYDVSYVMSDKETYESNWIFARIDKTRH